MLGETVANSISGNKPYGSSCGVVSGGGGAGPARKGNGSPDSPGCRPGVVTVVDVQSVVDPQVTACSSRLCWLPVHSRITFIIKIIIIIITITM